MTGAATAMDHDLDRQGLAWQTGVWDKMSDIYAREIDQRFAPVVESVLARAELRPGERVLDLGTGTGAVAEQAARAVGPRGEVVGVDISAAMLALARRRAEELGLSNLRYAEGRGEDLPAARRSLGCGTGVPQSHVRHRSRRRSPGDRAGAAAGWPPGRCGVGRAGAVRHRTVPADRRVLRAAPTGARRRPGALADSSPLLAQLDAAGIDARVEMEILGFDFPSFSAAWDALAGVTTAQLEPEQRQEAQAAVRTALYPDGDAPRHFRNETQFVLGTRRR